MERKLIHYSTESDSLLEELGSSSFSSRMVPSILQNLTSFLLSSYNATFFFSSSIRWAPLAIDFSYLDLFLSQLVTQSNILGKNDCAAVNDGLIMKSMNPIWLYSMLVVHLSMNMLTFIPIYFSMSPWL